MKNIFKKSFIPAFLTVAFTTSCSDFAEINTDPRVASESQVQVEYFINNSITGNQQDPLCQLLPRRRVVRRSLNRPRLNIRQRSAPGAA